MKQRVTLPPRAACDAVKGSGYRDRSVLLQHVVRASLDVFERFVFSCLLLCVRYERAHRMCMQARSAARQYSLKQPLVEHTCSEDVLVALFVPWLGSGRVFLETSTWTSTSVRPRFARGFLSKLSG